MKKIAVLTLFAVLATLVFAQAKNEPKYNKAAEVKLSGVVDEVKDVPCGKDSCVVLTLQTEKAVATVQIAPEAFLKDMEVKFAKGDKLLITAAKITAADGNDLYLAREITQNGNLLVVRDPEGGPVWTWKKG